MAPAFRFITVGNLGHHPSTAPGIIAQPERCGGHERYAMAKTKTIRINKVTIKALWSVIRRRRRLRLRMAFSQRFAAALCDRRALCYGISSSVGAVMSPPLCIFKFDSAARIQPTLKRWVRLRHPAEKVQARGHPAAQG
jgi:hypothetical protein